jgi:hypothetical protein
VNASPQAPRPNAAIFFASCSITLPGGIKTTTSMIFADIDNDGFLDLVVGN